MPSFAGRHRGQRCFVVGSGPSIGRMSLDWLRDEIPVWPNESPGGTAGGVPARQLRQSASDAPRPRS
jgi:hypothetical protein